MANTDQRLREKQGAQQRDQARRAAVTRHPGKRQPAWRASKRLFAQWLLHSWRHAAFGRSYGGGLATHAHRPQLFPQGAGNRYLWHVRRHVLACLPQHTRMARCSPASSPQGCKCALRQSCLSWWGCERKRRVARHRPTPRNWSYDAPRGGPVCTRCRGRCLQHAQWRGNRAHKTLK